MKKKIEKRGFTIVEILTVMSIIVILTVLLLPALTGARRYAREVRQSAQFHAIEAALEMFSNDFDGYPDSSRYDLDRNEYCGAMKLCEALVGQDGLGFHPDSRFDDLGKDKNNEDLYFNRIIPPPEPPYTEEQIESLRARKLPYLEGDVDVCNLGILFSRVVPVGDLRFDLGCAVLCDAFSRSQLQDETGESLGMPILYYKADPSKLEHDPNNFPDVSKNIYDVFDNYDLTDFDPTWGSYDIHPLFESEEGVQGEIFYQITENDDVHLRGQPHNPETYILISAGFDGVYGTSDDIFNFTD